MKTKPRPKAHPIWIENAERYAHDILNSYEHVGITPPPFTRQTTTHLAKMLLKAVEHMGGIYAREVENRKQARKDIKTIRQMYRYSQLRNTELKSVIRVLKSELTKKS